MLRATGLVMTLLAVMMTSPALAKGKEADFRVWTEKDNFKPGIVAVRSTPIRVKDVKFTSPWFALLEAGYIYSEDGTLGTHVFDVMYFGSEWMFWDQLTAKVGEDVRSLKLVGQPRREQVTLGLEEHLRFEVPGDFFEKMTAAPMVDFRVNGKFYYDFSLNNTGTSYLKQLQSFIREHAPELKTVKALGVEMDSKKEGPAAPDYIQELRELAKLRNDGIISEEEFQAKKRKLLGLDAEQKPSPAEGDQEKKPKESGSSEKPPTLPPPNAAAHCAAAQWQGH